jgi:spore protease
MQQNWDGIAELVKNYRTDLAVETREMITRHVREDIPGVRVETVDHEDVTVTRVDIMTPEGERIIGKMRGRYVTLEAPGLRKKNTPLQNRMMELLTEELVRIINLPRRATTLIVGLGNWNVTPDALGPRVTEQIVVTRHLQDFVSPELKEGVRSVCAFSPGVLGLTGIETAEIVAGVVNRLKPDVVICIDALAAASSSRVTTTIQLSNTGINPGSGVGNKRFGLTQESLGVPVIAIGVPTVVHAANIANDTITTLIEHAHFNRFFKSMQNLSPADRQSIVSQVLPAAMGDLMVTPKEIDTLISDIAEVVAGGINSAMHPHIDYDNIHMYLNFN